MAYGANNGIDCIGDFLLGSTTELSADCLEWAAQRVLIGSTIFFIISSYS